MKCQLCRRQCKSTICTIVGDMETGDERVDAFVQRRKLILKGNPFASEALLRSHLPMPEKRELVTQLTISESELEAELKQHFEPEKSGLGSFVTAPTTFNDEKLRTTVSNRKLSPGVDDITLTMSRELLSEDIHLQQDNVSPPSFNPQPPGKINMPK
uniref:LOB domain-containing protein n=1 Tax=Meloidogyne hapla TaxID=6305 RepID=A0A1I8BGJ4_MELHA